jgi:hypothetical protein
MKGVNIQIIYNVLLYNIFFFELLKDQLINLSAFENMKGF